MSILQLHLFRLAWGLQAAFLLSVTLSAAQPPYRVLDRHPHLLRTGAHEEWSWFATRQPEGNQLELRFAAEASPSESTLFIQQDDVKWDWPVALNGRPLGKLFAMEARLLNGLAIPGGLLRTGKNTLVIGPGRDAEDIVVEQIALDSRPRPIALAEGALEIVVTEGSNALPCRLTIVNEDGVLVPMTALSHPPPAIRPGVAYLADGRARLGLRAGKYTVYATRGFEYSLAQGRISVDAGKETRLRLSLEREVDTRGWVACDTHIHTLELSGHGDATLAERMITLAGEGIELPIATEHNRNADYAAARHRLGLSNWFTAVTGNEITTKAGHFNAFPFLTNSPAPDAQIEHWPDLMRAIRQTTNVQVVILNHPRGFHSNFIPFAPTNYDAATGENLRGFDFTFDAIELAHSGALRSDIMQVYRDWFALLNHGYRIPGVGSSDSHDVSRYIVGQGRTYIPCPDSDLGHIDVDLACRNLRAGRAVVSLGLLTRMKVNGTYSSGDLATGIFGDINVQVLVDGPSWIRADKLEIFANGVKVQEVKIPDSRRVRKLDYHWTYPKPGHDVHLVAIATGPGVTGPYWAISRPYQPDSTSWTPRVIGSTNPIWVDADGDGKFTPPREYARALLVRMDHRLDRLLPALGGYDEAVAVQAAALCRSASLLAATTEFQLQLDQAEPFVRAAFQKVADGFKSK